MDSATSATRVMLPKAVTKSLHSKARCSLPLTRLHPLACARCSFTSASLNFFGGMASSSGTFVSGGTIMRRKRRSGNHAGPSGGGLAARIAARANACARERLPARRLPCLDVECPRKLLYRRGFLCTKNARCAQTLCENGERSEKENSRHTIWGGSHRRVHCTIDA